jgi:2-polyprenyl-3-methyl-5-hydroxy-6-metoxy-1,4-benzoquinol methylase
MKMSNLPKWETVKRVDHLVAACAGRRVFNVGLGGYLDDDERTDSLFANVDDSLQARLASAAKSIAAIDLNPRAVRLFSTLTVPGRYIEASLTDPKLLDAVGDERFDVVLLGDVLEHVDDFRTALANAQMLLVDGGEVVISTVNAYSAEAIAKLLFRYESVHPEHTCYFSYSTLKRLLHMNGLEAFDGKYYYEPRGRHDGIASTVGAGLLLAASRIAPQYASGLIMHARSKN